MIPPQLILLFCLYVFWRLLKRDVANRPGVSSAIWIPTLWVGIIASRPLSMWLGFGGAEDTLEGSPADRLFFIAAIFASLVVLARRRLAWSAVISRCWPLFLFYGFLLVSVLWANSPLSSFKRWFKEFGNIVVLLVILTEEDPQQAVRAVFVRCGYVLIPLSEVYIRWFPYVGRRYNIHSGVMEATGVTCQKNSLGVLVLVCSLLMLWDWFEAMQNRASQDKKQARLDGIWRAFVLSLGVYLLHLCDSKTSIVCLGISAGILSATRFPLLRKRLSMLGGLALAGGLALYLADQAFDLKGQILSDLGRDATFTGRTDVWRELRNAGTDPTLGTGFMSFWDDKQYQSKLPNWVAYSAHNGYLEIYLAGGYVGIFFLSIMLLGVGLQINRSLSWGGDYSVFRFAVYAVALIANFTESNFAEMTPLGFLFLLAAIGYAETASAVQAVPKPLRVMEVPKGLMSNQG